MLLLIKYTLLYGIVLMLVALGGMFSEHSGIIIYLCAFSMLFRGKIHALLFRNADKTNVNAEPAPAETKTKKEGK